ncbi:hypothetical protein BV898_19095 [Hypsibius exemplaris]|uniref:serine--tRNA ligase n=1 Tax=Hypsibius exemplaris TaxID=2072580 RepID=A0A9X6RNL6_HYPEX|nr:hypothetical protein BV898_19095 [Hypsibius exemplaris]
MLPLRVLRLRGATCHKLRASLLHRGSFPKIFSQIGTAATAAQPTKKNSIPADYIEPLSALFVSGVSGRYGKFVVDPCIDFNEILNSPPDEFPADLTARNRSDDLAHLRKRSSELEALGVLRDELEAKRRGKVSGMSIESEEEHLQEIRRSKDELKKVMALIAEIEADTVLELLRLPVPLHDSAPRSSTDLTLIQEFSVVGMDPVNRCKGGPADEDRRWAELVEFTEDAPRGYFLRGDLAEMELEVIAKAQNFLDSHSFLLISGPHLFQAAIMEGVGEDLRSPDQLDAFIVHTEDSHGSPFRSMYLANSPLVNFAAYLTNCQVRLTALPLRLQSSGRIYRPRRGVPDENRRFRLFYPSQTHCVSFCSAFSSDESLNPVTSIDILIKEALECFQQFYTQFGIPFRIKNKAACFLRSSEAFRLDVEVWLPSLGAWIECGHAAFHADYVSRRLRCHVGMVDEGRFLSLVQGSLVELTPFLAAYLEHYASGPPDRLA